MYLSKETVGTALARIEGTANPLLKVWLKLKVMGLSPGHPVLVDNKNSTSALKMLFTSGHPNGRFCVPFSPTTSDRWMNSDASRSIIQTTIKKRSSRLTQSEKCNNPVQQSQCSATSNTCDDTTQNQRQHATDSLETFW